MCVVLGTAMATVFDLAMPVLDDAQNLQARQQRRRADSIEIIDVDQLDDALCASTTMCNKRRLTIARLSVLAKYIRRREK